MPATKMVVVGHAPKVVLGKSVLAAASKISKDPKKARAFLEDAGIITKSGKLASRYG